MTRAHLGGRGVGRKRGNTAEIATRGVGRRRGHGDRCHHPRPQRSFFSPNSDRCKSIFLVAKLCSWTRPNVSKPALSPYLRIYETAPNAVETSNHRPGLPWQRYHRQHGRGRLSNAEEHRQRKASRNIPLGVFSAS